VAALIIKESLDDKIVQS